MTYLHKTGPRLLTITKIRFSLFTGSLGQQIDEFKIKLNYDRYLYIMSLKRVKPFSLSGHRHDHWSIKD